MNDSTTGPSRALPNDASLENLRKRAKTLVREHASGMASAIQRVRAVLPSLDGPLRLHDAQLVIARELGIPSWPKLVQRCNARRPERRVQREDGRVWLNGVPRLRWGASPEPTYVGALEAAFRGTERPLNLVDLMGDSGLCFRARWALRNGGESWCGSGPCGEWPEEVAALNVATGYVMAWIDADVSPGETRARVKSSLDQGYPVLAFPSHLDVGFVFGYEEEGELLLVADYWASEFPERHRITDMMQIGCFVEDVQQPAPRAAAVRAGLRLALARFREGVVDPDPMTGATYYYGVAGLERWAADLERVPELSAEQLPNLYHVSSWTFSGLHQGRTKYAAEYLRRAASHLGSQGGAHLVKAAELYDELTRRLGPWDARDPLFGMVKQQPIESWTREVRRREIELLRDVSKLEARAMECIERALGD